MPGTLYLVSTPIGNPEDLTFRAVRILQKVRFIAAEDPRITRELLDHHSIATPLTTYHQLNKEEKIPVIVKRLQDGDDVALVCDAGTPVLADPGAFLVSQALTTGISVVAIPGVSAVTAALPASGLSCSEFVFLGLFPKRAAARQRLAGSLCRESRTAVLFVHAGDLRTALDLLRSKLRRRQIVLVNNLTTPEEALYRGTTSRLLRLADSTELRGEITLVIEGSGKGIRRSNRRRSARHDKKGSTDLHASE